MKLRTAARLLRNGQLAVLFGALRIANPFYEVSWLVSAARAGLLRRLAAGPATLATLAGEMTRESRDRDWLEKWLELGVRTGQLHQVGSTYSLRSRLARGLARPENDPILAILEEVATLHHRLVIETPQRLAAAERFTLADQDGVLIARSSPLVRPFLHEAIDEVVPRRGAMRLLEVGAGSATYIRYAAERNPDLRALGLELQPDVAEFANSNLRAWGLASRATVDKGDVRDRVAEPTFDLMTFHNNIYYFPVDERVALLRHALDFLAPGGRILLTTACSGGSPAAVALDIWSAGTERCGRLPAPDELVEQMKEAGFVEARHQSLIPGDRYYAFYGRKRA
ncbi:L-tyrosine C(3)-methyltransferase [Myxococcaceae bacterium]|jgi:SAM-dependent methyltransferase|nr:L-tyrosine C(3)-methyltransferase [Myxococcaceae bacterium]